MKKFASSIILSTIIFFGSSIAQGESLTDEEIDYLKMK